jgi:hypothetical protein
VKVQFIRERSFQAAGSQGPLTRVFAIGEVVDLPEMHARMVIIQGDAKVASAKAEKPAPVEDDAEVAEAPKPAAKRKK